MSYIVLKYRTHEDLIMEQLFDSITGKNHRQDVEVIPCWSSGGGAAAKPADQDNSWEVHATVQDNSTDWGVHHFLSYRNYFTQ